MSVISLVRTPVLEDAADLHPRARVAADAIAADLRAAGNGTSSGPLAAVLPATDMAEALKRPDAPAFYKTEFISALTDLAWLERAIRSGEVEAIHEVLPNYNSQISSHFRKFR